MANVFSQIGAWFSRQRTALIGKVWTFGNTEVYPKIDSTTAIARGFNGNAAVYSIVKKDAKKFGSVARYVEAASKEQKSKKLFREFKEVEALPGALTDLLNRPNPSQGQDAFFTLVRAFYKVCGESFIWLNRGDTDALIDDTLVELDDAAQMKKPVLEMYVLPPNKVIVVPDPENVFAAYGYILESNVRIPIRKTDIIHWKDINLTFDIVSRDHLRGMSALMPGGKTLEANNSATDATVRMNQNGGARKLIANKSLAQMTPQQQSQLDKVLDEKVNNADIKGAVTAMQGDWSGIDLGLTSVDMETLKGKVMSTQELCNLFGLPYELFDSATTFANKEMAQKSWVINEIMPDCKQLDGEMNRVLPIAFGLDKKAVICSDFDDMPELQDDKKKQIDWLMKGPFTANEIREATGYDKSTDEGSDKVLLPSGYQLLDTLAGDMGQQAVNDAYANAGTDQSFGN